MKGVFQRCFHTFVKWSGKVRPGHLYVLKLFEWKHLTVVNDSPNTRNNVSVWFLFPSTMRTSFPLV